MVFGLQLYFHLGPTNMRDGPKGDRLRVRKDPNFTMEAGAVLWPTWTCILGEPVHPALQTRWLCLHSGPDT